MDDALLRRLLGREVNGAPAHLEGFERRRARYFYICPSEGALTQGRLLHGLSERDFAILDQYEGAPHLYTRERIKVCDAGGALVSCWVYRPTELARRGPPG
jgi:hypothetical protein